MDNLSWDKTYLVSYVLPRDRAEQE